METERDRERQRERQRKKREKRFEMVGCIHRLTREIDCPIAIVMYTVQYIGHTAIILCSLQQPVSSFKEEDEE